MRAEKCCLCIERETGVYLIGAITTMGVFYEIFHFQPFRAAILAIAIITFFLTIFKNSAFTRFLWLAAFVVKVVGDNMINFALATPEQGGYDLDNYAKTACEVMSEEDLAKFEEIHGECAVIMRSYIFYATIAWMVIAVPLVIHFIVVLYSYW